ncbi:MAG: ROK family protein, partial [Thermoleophilia bacterium]|nr:ROK family protein [Thermoleophilia bacterium]
GRAVTTVNLPLADVPIRDLMSERLGLPVAIDNDANVAALAEQRFGAARGKRDVVLLTLGTGVGGGVVIDGKSFRGAAGSGAELGHMTVLADGPPCQGNCPNRGCLETMCSGTAIARDATEVAGEHPDSQLGQVLAADRELTGALVTELAAGGDNLAMAVLARAGFYLGTGIVSLVNVFNPQAVVIGGGAAAAGELMLGPAREVVRERALSPNKELCEIVPARFGAEAGMLGAALLAFDECLGVVAAPTET